MMYQILKYKHRNRCGEEKPVLSIEFSDEPKLFIDVIDNKAL